MFVTDWRAERASRCAGGYRSYKLPRHSKRESARECHKVQEAKEGWMNLQPLGDRLIVEALEDEETTVSGIVLPDTAKEKPQRGRVLAVGPGARNDKGELVPMDVAEGDEIIFSKYGGTEIKLGTDEVLVLRETDVLAKVVGGGSKGSKKKKEMAGASA
jgi:chaperonin GroES